MFSFPASSRLRNSRDYTQTWQRGRKHHTAHLLVVLCAGLTGPSRLGITVSRKVGNAVCRNRLKRWIRESFRQHRHKLGVSVDINVIAKRQAGTLGHADLNRELQNAFATLENSADV